MSLFIFIHKALIWFNQNIKIDIEESCFDKGIRTLNDIVDSLGRPMELDEFQESFNFRTIFLEYGSLCIEIKNFPNYKDFPICKSTLPRNSYLNIIVSKDAKGISSLYRNLHSRHYDLIEEACDKWNKNENISLSTTEI